MVDDIAVVGRNEPQMREHGGVKAALEIARTVSISVAVVNAHEALGLVRIELQERCDRGDVPGADLADVAWRQASHRTACRAS